MVRYIFLRGTLRDTTLRIVEDIVIASYDRMDKTSLLKLLTKEFDENDVVIHDDLGLDAMFLMLLKPLGRYKVVIRLRGDAFEVLRNGPYILSYYPRKLMTGFILRNANYILFNSQQLSARKDYGFASSRSGVAYNPLMLRKKNLEIEEIDRDRDNSSCFRLLTVTNFHFPKKIAPLAAALHDWITPEFLHENNIQWDIVGGGHYHAQFMKDVQIERFGGRVNVHGFSDDVTGYYKKSHLCVYLSGFDAFPNVVLEASYYGLPIITNPESCGTLEAMVDGKTGKIVTNAEELMDTILRYKIDPALRVVHGLAAHKFVVENFSVNRQKKMATKLLKSFFEGPSISENADRDSGR